MSNGPIYVDNSILTKVAVCDTASVLRYVLGYTSQEERAVLKSGHSGHEALAKYLANDCDAQLARNTFQTEYERWATENVLDESDSKSFANTSRCLDRWLETHTLAQLPFQVNPSWVEIGFSFPLTQDGKYVFVGRMDAIVTDDRNDIRVLDHKFTGKLDSYFAKQYRMDSQMSGYIWAAQQQLERKVVGGFINAIEFARVPSSDRKCNEHGVKYSECGLMHCKSQIFLVNRTPDQITRWKLDAIALAQRYEKLLDRFSDEAYIPLVPMQGQFVYRACAFCEFQDFCAVDRPAEQLSTVYKHEPWEPFKHAFGEKENAA